MPESFWDVEDCTTGFPIIKTSWGTLWNTPLASFVWWFASLICEPLRLVACIVGDGGPPPPLEEIYIDEHNPFEIACSTDLISAPQDSSYMSQNSNSPKIAVFQHLINIVTCWSPIKTSRTWSLRPQNCDIWHLNTPRLKDMIFRHVLPKWKTWKLHWPRALGWTHYTS